MNAALSAELDYQRRILPGVSRTFALTIPTLPEPLSTVVANGYLLCRIADTIEDDAALGADDKAHFSQRFVAVVEGSAPAEAFAEALAPALAAQTPADERDLVAHTASVVRLTHSFSPTQRAALARCVRIMGEGMAEFQQSATPAGLPDMAAMDRYCYVVAGVVGEMLTELFCEHSEGARLHRDELMALAVSFGQGLQMTNILKDIWTDHARGACWLPRDLFAAHGCELAHIEPGSADPGFEAGLGELLAVAHGHLRNALRYTLLLPAAEPGMRRFCLWALGMAVLTLRRIDRRRNFSDSGQVKISRRAVRTTVAVTSALAGHDRALRGLFRLAARGLPVSSDRERLSAVGCGSPISD